MSDDKPAPEHPHPGPLLAVVIRVYGTMAVIETVGHLWKFGQATKSPGLFHSGTTLLGTSMIMFVFGLARRVQMRR